MPSSLSPSTISWGYSSACSSSVATGRICSSTKVRTALRISVWSSVSPSVSHRRPMTTEVNEQSPPAPWPGSLRHGADGHRRARGGGRRRRRRGGGGGRRRRDDRVHRLHGDVAQQQVVVADPRDLAAAV